MYTSPEHYRTNMFLMKNSKTKRPSDTAVIHTKNITNPVVTHGDRVVQAAERLAESIGALAGKKQNDAKKKNDANMEDLRKLAEATKSLADRNRSSARNSAPCVALPDILPAPRVAE